MKIEIAGHDLAHGKDHAEKGDEEAHEQHIWLSGLQQDAHHVHHALALEVQDLVLEQHRLPHQLQAQRRDLRFDTYHGRHYAAGEQDQGHEGDDQHLGLGQGRAAV